MDEFIREVDEEYRRDQIANFWRRYNGLIIAAAVLLVAAVGGWRYYEYSRIQRSQTAASRYDDALKLSRDGKSEESEKALAALAGDAPAGYRLLARFRLAAEQGKSSPEAGAKAYDALAGDAAVDGTMQDLARLRAAMLRLDTPDTAGAEQSLERLASPTNPWRHTARELLGLTRWKSGDYDGASRWFDQIAADRDTPQGLRARLEIYSALAAGGPVKTK